MNKFAKFALIVLPFLFLTDLTLIRYGVQRGRQIEYCELQATSRLKEDDVSTQGGVWLDAGRAKTQVKIAGHPGAEYFCPAK